MSREAAMTTNLGRQPVNDGNPTSEAEPVDVLVKDRHTAQIATRPLRLILVHLGVHGLEERAHEGYLPGRACNGTLIPDIFDYVQSATVVVDPQAVGNSCRSLTLIVRHQEQKECDNDAPAIQAFVQLTRQTSGVRFERRDIESVGERGGEGTIRHVRRH